ncbi:hypothetical protein BG844_28945 [Couchioplanes caeruleus subsp. caeruleus]|uniref:Uncharacterized protein n=1 Tax=Couchioplanes caeruleus subsp. caeruleus TaxID=56427 RepID=A0A1K0G139_9ACTN|nr:hypothetical protein BG844_28945 [Couchioplanes caeruleus subsp. caeruleus]
MVPLSSSGIVPRYGVFGMVPWLTLPSDAFVLPCGGRIPWLPASVLPLGGDVVESVGWPQAASRAQAKRPTKNVRRRRRCPADADLIMDWLLYPVEDDPHRTVLQSRLAAVSG